MDSVIADKLKRRRDVLKEQIGELMPYICDDQKHLTANTPEWAYWHHGYCMALSDVLKQLSSQADDNADRRTGSRSGDPDE